MPALEIDVAIDRGSPVPLYHQLAEQLTSAIRDGDLAPGDPFENEVAMASRLTLSRPTVRRAIQELVDQGMLIRQRGRGTTVASPKVHRQAALSSLHDDLVDQGRHPRTTVLQRELVTDAHAAWALELPEDTELLHLLRVRHADDEPLALLQNWLPPSFADITTEELEDAGLYAVLRRRGARPAVAQQSIGARMPTASERRALSLRAKEPLLTMSRLAFDAVGSPVELGEHVYRAQAYTIDLVLDER